MANETTAPSKPAPKKSVALSGVVAGNTALCTVGRTGNDLHYRGYDILDVAETCEFEEVAHLLVHGSLPTPAELAAYKARLKSLRGLPLSVRSTLEALPAAAHPMRHSEFNDIIDAIGAMDADVISIETSRSKMELLDAFRNYRYPNEIGPGVYDIHSPRIPDVGEMTELLKLARQRLSDAQLWINPDCGLKTRKWDEVKPALANMVAAARELRALA